MSSQSEDKFCFAPWYHSFVHPDGTIHPCCISWDKMGDTSKGDSIDSVWNGEAYQALREQFLKGEVPAGCKICFIKEKSGILSKRQLIYKEITELSEFLLPEPPSKLKTIAEKNFVSLDLSMGNQCNLRCRFCGPHNSTKWIQNKNELYKLNPDYWKKHFGSTKKYTIVEQKASSYRDLLLDAKHLRLIELKGGEPFMLAEHLELLKLLIEGGISSNIELAYTSNGTVLQKEVKDLFPRFKRISLSLSVDGVGELYSYIRGESYVIQDVEKALQFYRQIENLKVGIHFTLNAYNIFGVKDFVNWLCTHELENSWGLGSVAFPQALRVSSVPLAIRKKAAAELNGLQGSNIEKIRNILLAPEAPSAKADYQDFLTYIRDLDQVRKTDLNQVVPELSEF